MPTLTYAHISSLGYLCLHLWVLPWRDEETPLNWLKTIELPYFKMTGWRLQNLMHWLLLSASCLARVLTPIFGTSFASLSQPLGFSLRKWALPCLASPGLNGNVPLNKAWFSFGLVSVQFISTFSVLCLWSDRERWQCVVYMCGTKLNFVTKILS